jgi:hypothetical protein
VQVGTECTYSQLYVYVQRALEVEHLCLRELCKRNLEWGGFFTGDLGGCVKEGSGDSISIWAPLGNLEGGLCTGDVAR